jgi:hypothetical protein
MMMLTTALVIIFGNMVLLSILFGWWGLPIYAAIGILCGLVFYPHMADNKWEAEGLAIAAAIWPVSFPFFIYWLLVDRKR